MACFAGEHPFLPAMIFPSNLSAFGPGSFMSPVAQPEPKREALLTLPPPLELVPQERPSQSPGTPRVPGGLPS